MNILQNLQNLLGQSLSGFNQGQGQNPNQSGTFGEGVDPYHNTNNTSYAAGPDNPWSAFTRNLNNGSLGNLGNGLGKVLDPKSGILGPAALGGLVGALFNSRGIRGMTGGALLAGTGAALWNKYKDRIRESNTQANPAFGKTPSAPDERAERIVRALVYAAKSDGQVGDAEKSAIRTQLQKADVTNNLQSVVDQALNEPLDPQKIASGVKTEDEALELYTISFIVSGGADQFMERQYLDALAMALKIPDDVKTDLEAKLKQSA